LESSDQPKPQDEEGPPETPGTPRKPQANNNTMLIGAKDSDLARRLVENAPPQHALDTRTSKRLKAISTNPEVAAHADATLRALIPGFDRVR
jgi:hypothetical protein